MRRLAACLIALALANCKPSGRRVAAVQQEEEVGLRSTVHAGDPRAAQQLVKGFHQIEQGAWRWTQGRFTVTLRPPATAAQKGAVLALQFSLPDALFERSKTVTVSANVNGASIPVESYTKSPAYSYRKDVPASALAAEAVTAEFAVEPFLKAGEVEQRELAMIFTSVGLEAK